MNVFIVTEAGKNIGFGHLMRCLSLEPAFRRRKITPLFIINGGQGVGKIMAGKKYILLNWLKDQKRFFKMIDKADIVIVDSYLADRKFYERISGSVKLAVYNDDYQRLVYPRGVVMNTTVYAKDLNYPKSSGVEYLLGPSYSYLRKEFCSIPLRKLRQSVRNILVTVGGSDFLNLTPVILNILVRRFPDIKKTVVIGNFFSNETAIRRASDKRTRIVKHADANGMKTMMLDADWAVIGAGQTLVELSRVGVPALGLCVAENQRQHLKKWIRLGFDGLFDPCDQQALENTIVRGVKKYAPVGMRRAFRSRIKKIVNPNGSDAIVSRLVKKVNSLKGLAE